ncbi:MAG TPA: cbb3-type cytochrome oxidase assembly protein CcoS [Casimicrobiaceae bacterium]|nr:cbb3-type cytochrome oxidase assembly protein CcoS [Casimicrobiaceae bacterium]
MEILYLLIPLSVALAFLIGAAFWWSVASGQFDDLEGPAHRILLDDDGWPAKGDAAPRSEAVPAIDLHQRRKRDLPIPSPESSSPASGAAGDSDAVKEQGG